MQGWRRRPKFVWIAQPPRAVWLDYEGAEGLDDLGLEAAAR